MNREPDCCRCGHLRDKHRYDVGYEQCRALRCACRRFVRVNTAKHQHPSVFPIVNSGHHQGRLFLN